jgi:hypothetical protein
MKEEDSAKCKNVLEPINVKKASGSDDPHSGDLF